MRDIHLSIISHGQIDLVKNLLSDIETQSYKDRLIVTLTINIPEDIPENFGKLTYPIQIIHNSNRKGFSENHNAAFNQANILNDSNYFLVVNPDVHLQNNVISPLINALDKNTNLGLVAPVVHGTDNTLEDSARELPTPLRIIAKLFGSKGIWDTNKCNQPDWVAGMFMVFKSDAYQKIGGFNEKYFLYYEDVDICSRLWLAGYTLQIIEDASILHDAQRASRRNYKYLRWHITSMFRFFSSDTYSKIKIFHLQRTK